MQINCTAIKFGNSVLKIGLDYWQIFFLTSITYFNSHSCINAPLQQLYEHNFCCKNESLFPQMRQEGIQFTQYMFVSNLSLTHSAS